MESVMNQLSNPNTLPMAQLWILQLFCYEESLEFHELDRYYKRMPEVSREEISINSIIEHATQLNWIIKKEGDGDFSYKVSEEFSTVRQSIIDACSLKREAWRSLLIEHVCNYVEVPIDHPLRSTLNKIDRKYFMPETKEYLADYDIPVSIKTGMTESAIHAVLMSIMPIDPKPGDHIMVCGAKGGLLGCLISELVGSKGRVMLLDWDSDIIQHVTHSLSNVTKLSKKPELILKEDVTDGYTSGAPWNAIILNGTVPKIPYDLIHQLDDENGRIIFFLADKGGSSQCLLVNKNRSIIKEEKLSRFRYTNIPGKYGFDELAHLQKQYQISRDNITNELVNKIQHLVHYPVSRSFMSAFNARDPHERHMRILKVGECLVKYLSIIALSEIHLKGQVQSSDSGTSRFSEMIHKLAGRPANGNWLSSLRDSLGLGKTLTLCQMIAGDWEKPWKNADIVAAQEMLIRETTRENNSGLRQVRLRDLLSKLIEYRNKNGEGHGNVISSSQAETNAGILIRAFGQLLPDLQVFKKTELICVHNTERKGDQDYVLVSQLSGSHFINHRFSIEEEKVNDWYKLSGHVILTDRFHQDLLSDIHPWTIWTDKGSNKENELYLFNSFQSGNYDYITYHNPSVYPDPNLKNAFSKVLSKYPEPSTAESNQSTEVFQGIIRGLLGVFLTDMRIQSYEMQALVRETIKHGIAETTEDAEKWIRNLIDRDFPGAYYGDE